MPTQELDGLSDDGLVKLGLRVDGIAPEGQAHEAETGEEEVAGSFEGPLENLYHWSIDY